MSKLRRANAEKLRTASGMAMSHSVLLCLDVDEVKTLSLHEGSMHHVDRRDRAKTWRVLHQELGTFSALPGESRYQVFLRLWEEAQCGGAALGPLPPESWVVG